MHEKTMPDNPASRLDGIFRCPNTKLVGFLLLGCLLATGGGWLAFNSFALNEYGPVQLAMAGVALLVISWRLGAHNRVSAWALLFAWYLGAGAPIHLVWLTHFGNNWGWAAWVIWAAIAAAPALLFPSRFAPYALAGGAAVTALTPIGMLNPIGAAIAFWPGGEWLGLAFALGVLMLPSIKHEKKFVAAAIVVLFWGALQNTWFDAEAPAIPNGAHAMETFEGWHPKLAVEWFGRQGRISSQVKADLESGARLVVTPEASTEKWDVWAEAVWRHARATAAETGGMALVGAYRETPSGWQNGLIDIATGEFYGGVMSMPIAMWRPWTKPHFPADLSKLPDLIKTPVGDAAYLICFEEMLLWPLAAKAGLGKPRLLITATNHWFSSTAVSEAQRRSVNLQARLWGLPLLRAVNWPAS